MSATICGSVRARAHAKINLSLRVLGRRDDGYHDLRTVFQALALHDTLTLSSRPGPLAIACPDSRVPADSSNLVWRAADALWKHLGRAGEARDLAMRIEKCIPMKAGLGGGSTDAAAALVGLAKLWDLEVPLSELASLGRQLGADVPFFLTGGTAAGAGRGDEIEPLADFPPHHVLLVFPPFDVSTAEAYRWVDEESGQVGPFDPSTSSGSPRAASRGDSLALAQGRQAQRLGDVEIANDFEPVVAARHPQITGIVADLTSAGAAAAAMTGSGSTVFGLFESEAAMAAAARRMNRLGHSLAMTRTLTREEYVRASAPACL